MGSVIGEPGKIDIGAGLALAWRALNLVQLQTLLNTFIVTSSTLLIWHSAFERRFITVATLSSSSFVVGPLSTWAKPPG